MAVICPTVLATTPVQYSQQLDRALGLSRRIQIDLADGSLASPKTVSLEQLYWPEGSIIDLHLMYAKPLDHIDTIIALRPNLCIAHQFSEASAHEMSDCLKAVGVRFGLVVSSQEVLSELGKVIGMCDHVLIYSGVLGKFGGSVDRVKIGWVKVVRQLSKTAEIGWDGGVDDKNIMLLKKAGVEVFNVGGFIQKATDSQAAYDILNSILKKA